MSSRCTQKHVKRLTSKSFPKTFTKEGSTFYLFFPSKYHNTRQLLHFVRQQHVISRLHAPSIINSDFSWGLINCIGECLSANDITLTESFKKSNYFKSTKLATLGASQTFQSIINPVIVVTTGENQEVENKSCQFDKN